MQKNTENYIKLDKVSRIYGTNEVPIKAVDEISFQIEKGEFVVIVGPSGAGKTTVLNILGGMDHATDGEVWVDGRNIAGYNSRQLTAYRRDDIGFVFQFYNLVPNLTALENVELAAQIRWMRLRYWKKLALGTGLAIFRLSFQEENSNVFPLQGPWQRIQR